MGWNERLQILYETSEPYLVRRMDQRDFSQDQHDLTGFCLGLCFHWIVQRLGGNSVPVPSLNMRRVRFAQAFGNLQAWARKGHLPTGRSASNLKIHAPSSSPWDPVMKDVVPDPGYQADVRTYESPSYGSVTRTDFGRTRQEMGRMDEDWYPEHVLNPALEAFKKRLRTPSKHFGYLSPMLEEKSIACVARTDEEYLSMGLEKVIPEEELRLRLTNRLKISALDGSAGWRRGFMKLYKRFLVEFHQISSEQGWDPMDIEVCGVIGWMGGEGNGAHAVALSYGGRPSEIRFFDPNTGDFAFSTWNEFRTWVSVMFAGLYAHRHYKRWDLEIYARLPP